MISFYFVAILANRLLALIAVLGLSYIMSPVGFGEYSIIVANSLLIQLFLGSWITSSATKFMSKSSENEMSEAFSTVIFAVLISLALLLVSSTIIILFFEDLFFVVISIFALSCSIIIFDVVLSVLNGTEQAKEYARLSISRAALSAIAPVSIAWFGGSAWKVAIAAAGTTFVSLVFSKPLQMLLGEVRRPDNLFEQVKVYVGSGVAGATVLGIYILLNSPLRNLVAFFKGADAAGYWALTSDIFYGPLAIAGSVATLSANRQLHRWDSTSSETGKADASTWYINMLVLAAFPYSAGGFLLGPDLAYLIFSDAVASQAAPLAGQFCIQNSAILVIYGLCHTAFTKERFRELYYSIISVTFSNLAVAALFLYLKFSLTQVVSIISIVSVASAFLIVFTFNLLGTINVDYKYIFKTCILTILMVFVIIIIKFCIDGKIGVFTAVFAGFILFSLGALKGGLLRYRVNSQESRKVA